VNGSLNYQLTPTALCHGDSAVININGGSGLTIIPSVGVTWLDSVTAILKPDTSTVFTISGFTACGAVTQTFTLPVINSDSISISSNKEIICPDDSAQICAPAGFSNYYWTIGDTTACIYTSLPGHYSVTISENGSCSAVSNTVAITLYPHNPVEITVNGDTLSTFTLGAYQWYLNDTLIPAATSNIYVAHISGSYSVQVLDSNGCILTSGLERINISGVAEEVPENAISIYPNPSTGYWQLKVTNQLMGAELEIFDATGRQLIKTEIKNLSSEISIPNAANGVYELRIVSKNFSEVRKLVKM
jgi:hypothetical protein